MSAIISLTSAPRSRLQDGDTTSVKWKSTLISMAAGSTSLMVFVPKYQSGIKKFFFPHGSFSIKDGSEISFWEDKWLGNTTLREQFPSLYNIARHKSDTLAKVMATSPPDVSFRRSLFGPRQASWNVLLQRLASVHLMQGPDEFKWNLKQNDKF